MKENYHYRSVVRDVGNRELTVDLVEELLDDWGARYRYGATYNQKVMCLRKLWRQANGINCDALQPGDMIRWAEFEFNVARRRTKRPQAMKPRRWPTDDDIDRTRQAMVANHGERNVLLFDALVCTGFRVSEIVDLRVRDTKYVQNGLLVSIKAKKTGKDIQRLLPQELAGRIADTFQGKVYLFETGQGRQYPRTTVSNWIASASKRAIGWSFRAHAIRHWWITKHAKDGVPAWKIAQMVGHLNIGSHANHYLHDEGEGA